MKRSLILLMVAGLIGGSVATAEAGKKKPPRVERTVRGSYGPSSTPFTTCDDPGGSLACVVVPTRSTEGFFTAKVTDALGQPVFVQVNNAHLGTFCGQTTGPISFEPGTTLEFRIEPITYFWSNWGTGWVGSLSSCPFRAKTTGTISVTLSNRR